MSVTSIIELQANHHPLEYTGTFRSIEEYVLHLMHRRAYEEAAAASEGATVLDLGCNNGWGTALLKQSAAYVVGLDVSPTAIDDASRRFGSPGIEFRCFDGATIPFANGTFDRVVSCQVIEHVEDTKAYLSEIARVLKPNGIAFFTTPNAAIRLDPGMKPWNTFHVREYKAGELQDALKTGFTEVTVRGLFATQEIYKVEYDRCQNALAGARERLHPRRPSIVAVVARGASASLKTCLPRSVVEILRRAAKRPGESKVNSATNTLAPSILAKYATMDIFYDDDHLEKALDFIAVCRGPKPQASPRTILRVS